MRTVKVFLASSIVEFEEERIYIGESIRKLNDLFEPVGQQVRLLLCEDEYINSQPFYDRNIEDSDIFIALIGNHLGEFTRHEIVEIADKQASIQKKIIALKYKESRSLIPDGLISDFDIIELKEPIFKDVINLIEDNIKDVVKTKANEPYTTYQDNFTVNIPEYHSLEVAVINNIIRRLRDQNNNITVHDDSFAGTEHAFIALLANSLNAEESRIKNILSHNINKDSLWVFAENGLSVAPNKDDYYFNLRQIHDELIQVLGNYPTYYSSYQILSVIFENKLLRALMNHNQMNGCRFIYIIEDHWLIRKYITTGKKHLFVNLLNICDNTSAEKQGRKERIIVNLLNQYLLNGKIDKHIGALEKLKMRDYDFFTYSLDDLDEIKKRDYSQAVFDYFCDKTERILLNSEKYGAAWVEEQMQSVLTFAESEVSKEELLKIHLMAGEVFSVYGSLVHKSIECFSEALNISRKLVAKDDLTIEILKHTIFSLCCHKIEINDQNDLIGLADSGLKLSSDDDFYSLISFNIIKYIALSNYKIKQKEVYEKITSVINELDVKEDNTILNLYLIFMVEWLQNQYGQFHNIQPYDNFIDQLIILFNRYLSFNEAYIRAKECLLSLKGLSANDLMISKKVVDEYKDTRPESERSKHFYDIQGNYGSLCLTNGLFDEAIAVFTKLSNNYRGDYDRAASLQRLALSYMGKYNIPQNLSLAEEMYNKSLAIYTNLNDTHMCGNIWDGLSYCLILQKRFKEAEEASLKAIETVDYQDHNKYSNYISSLLCQGKYWKAFNYYRKLQWCRESTRTQLECDWNKEMKVLDISKKQFFYLFKLVK